MGIFTAKTSPAFKIKVAGRLSPTAVSSGILLLVAIGFPFVYSDFLVFQANQVMVYGIAILGLVLLTGLTGTISIGHGAIFGIGAYATALGMHDLHLPYLVALLLALGVGAVAGILIGIPALRLRGAYLALVTLAMTLIFPPLVLRFESFTGGAAGYSVPTINAPAWSDLTLSQWLYFVTLVIGIAAIVVMQNIKRSARGRALRAIERSEPLAVAVGINVSRERITVFVISSAYSGLAGGLYALVSGAVAPDAFTFALSSSLLVGAVVGGITSPIGALIGGVLVAVVPTVTATLPHSLPEYIYAIAVLLAIYLRPEGLASVPAGLLEFSRALRRSKTVSATVARRQNHPESVPVKEGQQ